MVKKFHMKAKASAGLSQNRKGLTLVELIVAVAVLAIMITPILHAFYTSAGIETKARKLSEATDASQNIQEVIDSMSVTDFFDKDMQPAKSLLGYDTFEGNEDADTQNKSAIITGLKSGSSTFDAKVTFSIGTPGEDEDNPIEGSDAFYQLNQEEIVDYRDPDGTFSQPYDASENPDFIADTDFYAHTHATAFKRVREIFIDVENEADEEGVEKVFVYVTYRYLYSYQKLGVEGEASYVYEHRYSAIPGGATPTDDETPLSVYIMYYPFYANYNKATASSLSDPKYPDLGMITDMRENLFVYNREDIPVKLFLVKQWPMTATVTGITDGKKQYSYAPMDETELLLKEENYNLLIEEFHSAEYTGKGIIQTNATINLCNKSPINFHIQDYWWYNGSRMGGGINRDSMMNDSNIIKGNIINPLDDPRIYDIKIEIYESGEVDDGEAFATFRGSKVN